MFLFLSVESYWLAWKFSIRKHRKPVDVVRNVQHWGSSVPLTMIVTSAALRRDTWWLNAQNRNGASISTWVKWKCEKEMRRRNQGTSIIVHFWFWTSVITQESSHLLMKNHLIPRFRLEGKIECLTLIRMSGVDNWYYKKWCQSGFFFACLMHTAQALLGRERRETIHQHHIFWTRIHFMAVCKPLGTWY